MHHKALDLENARGLKNNFHVRTNIILLRSRIRDDEPGGQLGEAESEGVGGGSGAVDLALAHAALRHRGALKRGQVRGLDTAGLKFWSKVA